MSCTGSDSLNVFEITKVKSVPPAAAGVRDFDGQPVSVDGGRVHDVGVVSPVAAVGDHHVAFGDTWSDRRFTATGRGEQAEQEPD